MGRRIRQSSRRLILGILADLYADSWGPLSARWFRAGLVLLARNLHATLADFPYVFTDDAYRRRLVAGLDDPLGQQAWASFEAMGAPERAHQLAAPLNKIEEIIGRKVVRAVLAQNATQAKLDMRQVLATGKVVIVSLSAIGTPMLAYWCVGRPSAVSGRPRSLCPSSVRTSPVFRLRGRAEGSGRCQRTFGFPVRARAWDGSGHHPQRPVVRPTPERFESRRHNQRLYLGRLSSDGDGCAHLVSGASGGFERRSPEPRQVRGDHEDWSRAGRRNRAGDRANLPATGRYQRPRAGPSCVGERYGTNPADVDAALAERHKIGGADAAAVGRSRRKS